MGVGLFPAGQSSRRGWCAGTSPFNSLHLCACMDRHARATLSLHHHHHHHHHHQAQTGCALLFFVGNRCAWLILAGDHLRVVSQRRRERRLRSWYRHEQQTVRMALAAALHHSAGLREKVEKQQNGAPRGQKTAARAREGVEHELYEGLRAQKPPLPGKRPGLPPEPEPLGGAVTVGYVAAPAPLLAVPLLASAAGEAVDHSTLQFLLKHAIETKKALEEEERRRKVEEAIARLRAKVDAGEPLSASEHAAWYGTSSSSTGKRRKKKKRKRRKLPKAPLPRCRRPCVHQRQVPAVHVVRERGGAPVPVLRQCGGHSCYACRDVYPQCILCRRPSRSFWCCSWTVPPPDIGGVGFGSSPNLDTNHTFYELSLPSERLCSDSAAPRCCESVCDAMSCCGGFFPPDGAYDSAWCSVRPMTGKYFINYFQYQDDVWFVCMLNGWFSSNDEVYADNYIYFRFKLQGRSEKWELYLYGDMTIKVDSDSVDVLPRGVPPFRLFTYLATGHTSSMSYACLLRVAWELA